MQRVVTCPECGTINRVPRNVVAPVCRKCRTPLGAKGTKTVTAAEGKLKTVTVGGKSVPRRVVILAVVILVAAGWWFTAGAKSLHKSTCETDAIALGQSTPGTQDFYYWAHKRVTDGCV